MAQGGVLFCPHEAGGLQVKISVVMNDDDDEQALDCIWELWGDGMLELEDGRQELEDDM